MDKKVNKSSAVTLSLVGLIIICVIGYGIWQASGKGGAEKAQTSSEQKIELTNENLQGVWAYSKGEEIYQITFSDNNKFSYERIKSEDKSSVLKSSDGSYEIKENDELVLSVTVGEDKITESYKAVLSQNVLSVTGTSELYDFFTGKYQKMQAQTQSSTGTAASSQETTSTTVPTTVKQEVSTTAVPKNQITFEQLKGTWQTQAPYQGQVFFYQLKFFSDKQLEYITGWANSDISGDYVCDYYIDGDIIYITVPDEAGEYKCSYKLLLYKDSLTMVYVGGYPMNVSQGAGTSLAYQKVY